MAYAETKGSRRKITGGKRIGHIELGVCLQADIDSTTPLTHPIAGGQPQEDIDASNATTSTAFVCVDVQEDPETLPGIVFLTSRHEKFVGY